MSKINILVVDDRPEGILAVQAVLSSPFYNIVPAASGTEALKCLLQDDYAVILMDVQMPVMNGFETAAVIKTREKSKDIPIIFMSAINQDEQYVYQGYGVGAVDYLLKPFDPYILRSKVGIFVELYIKNQLIKDQTRKLYESEIKTYTQALDRLELESLRRFQGLADSIPQIVFRLNIDGSSSYFNKKWFEFTGLSETESKDNGWKEAFHPEDVSKLVEGFSLTKTETGLEVRIRNAKGQYRWHEIRIEPEFTGEDVISTWLSTAMDIEDRKRSADAQRFLAEAGALLVSSLDYESTIQTIASLSIPYLADWCSFDILVNDEPFNLAIRHTNPNKEYLVKKLHQNYILHPDADFGLKKVIKTGKTEIYPHIDRDYLESVSLDPGHLTLDLELKPISCVVVPLNVKGVTIGAITLVFTEDSSRTYNRTLIDVAEELGRRAALAFENSRLYRLSQEAIELRNDFLSIASHELNTPITSLKLQLQMTKKTLSLGSGDTALPIDKFKRSIDASVKQVDRLINLVQVLLDVSRIQSGKFTFNFEKVNLTDVLREVSERQNEILSNSGCELHLELDAEDIEAIVDKTRIEQVLINLMTNTIKYAPGKIDVSLKTVNDSVKLVFKDHGNGIPTVKLKKIFDRFERATSNESVGGLGLGLYIVKQIVEGHHGTIEVDSHLGQGTVFTVLLPKGAHQTGILSHH